MEAGWLHEKRNSAHSHREKLVILLCSTFFFFHLTSTRPTLTPVTVSPLFHAVAAILCTLCSCNLLPICLTLSAAQLPTPSLSLHIISLTLTLRGDSVVVCCFKPEFGPTTLRREERAEVFYGQLTGTTWDSPLQGASDGIITLFPAHFFFFFPSLRITLLSLLVVQHHRGNPMFKRTALCQVCWIFKDRKHHCWGVWFAVHLEEFKLSISHLGVRGGGKTATEAFILARLWWAERRTSEEVVPDEHWQLTPSSVLLDLIRPHVFAVSEIIC